MGGRVVGGSGLGLGFGWGGGFGVMCVRTWDG